MSEDSKDDANQTDADETPPDGTRRKILYVAPVLLSQRLFNSLTGCGKVDQTLQSCSLVAMTS